MRRLALALGVICALAGWNPMASAQQPYFGSGNGPSYGAGHGFHAGAYPNQHPQHRGHHHPHVNYGPNYGAGYGYTPPVMVQPRTFR